MSDNEWTWKHLHNVVKPVPYKRHFHKINQCLGLLSAATLADFGNYSSKLS